MSVMDEGYPSQSRPGETNDIAHAFPTGRAQDSHLARDARDYDAHGIPVKVRGDLSIGNAEDLLQLFREALSRHPQLVMDFAEVETCDTAVLQLICSLRKTLLQSGQRFRLAAIAPAIEHAAAAIGLPIQAWTSVAETAADDPSAGPGGSGSGL